MSGWPSPLKSPTPEMDQLVGTVPSDTLDENVVPVISQITRSPVVVLLQRMSVWPLWLKSPVPSISQSVETVPSETLEPKLVPSISQTERLPVLVSVQYRFDAGGTARKP